jgi:arsenite methyltransferase
MPPRLVIGVTSLSALKRLGIPLASRTALSGQSPGQRQTGDAFGFKWAQTESYGSPQMFAFTREWLLRKYCDGDPGLLRHWLAGGPRIILDAGCGSGFSARCLFGDLLHDHDYLGVDISTAVEVGRATYEELGLPGDFLQCDMTAIPIPDEQVYLILAEGSLHHTDDTGAAIASLARKLSPGGRFLFYVYARKAPLREAADDLVRQELAALTDEEAWEHLRPLTRLGIALGELGVEVEVPEAIPYLGIPAGVISVQELVYYSFVKAFYRPDWSFDEMHHVNFDWYRPTNARRHTEEEVRAFVDRAGLSIERFHAEPSGYSVVARKLSEEPPTGPR